MRRPFSPFEVDELYELVGVFGMAAGEGIVAVDLMRLLARELEARSRTVPEELMYWIDPVTDGMVEQAGQALAENGIRMGATGIRKVLRAALSERSAVRSTFASENGK